jgi:pimeloyl-ACP methyl ester carboxylesterase
VDRLLSPQERNRWGDIYARRLGFACALGIGFMLFLGVSLGAAIGSGRALTGRDLVIILLLVAAVLTVIVAYTRTLRTHRRRWRGAVDKPMLARVPVVISRRSSGKWGVFLDLSLPDGQSWHVRQEDGYRPFQVGDQVLTEIYPSDEGGCVGAIWADRTGTITRFSAATLPSGLRAHP